MAAFKDLDPLLHSQLRLAIVSILVGVAFADFNFLLEKTEASKGNLSVQLKKLEAANYIQIKKSFKNNYPHTRVSITKIGQKAFKDYAVTLKDYLGGS